MKTVILISISICAHAFAACHIVAGPNITGADLAAADASFASIDTAAIIATSPMPRVPRVFHSEEIIRIARQYHVDVTLPIADFCFERAIQFLTPEILLPALHAAIASDAPDAQIEILDFTRTGVPIGTLIFNRAGLSESGLWRGRIAYDQAKSAPIWVRTRVTTERSWIEASQTIAAGTLLDASQLAIHKGPRFPFGAAPLGSIDAAVGSKPLRTLKPGEPIFALMLVKPHDVEHGETVHVVVAAGEARLEFDAVAQSSARVGEHVLIKNPENGHLFQAFVKEKGKVAVTK